MSNTHFEMGKRTNILVKCHPRKMMEKGHEKEEVPMKTDEQTVYVGTKSQQMKYTHFKGGKGTKIRVKCHPRKKSGKIGMKKKKCP